MNIDTLPSVVPNMDSFFWKYSQPFAGYLKDSWVWLFDSDFSTNEDTVKKLLKPKLVQNWPEPIVKVADNGQLHPCIQDLVLQILKACRKMFVMMHMLEDFMSCNG